MNKHLSLRCTALSVATALALASTASAQGRLNLSGLQAGGEHQRFIVKYRTDSAARLGRAGVEASLSQAARALPARNGQALGLRSLRRLAIGADVVSAGRALDRAEAETLMRQLAAQPDVEYVEVDVRMHPVLTPNDTRYGDQWHYSEATGGIRANQAWDVTTGTGVVVAVLDTGITRHSDLDANVLAGYDFIADVATANDGNGRDSDASDPGDSTSASSWHGTHVAGTIAAVTNNAKGVAGVAHGAKILPVRVLGKGGGYLSDIADGIVWASGGSVSGVPANQNPAEVINMSLGGSGSCTSTYQSAINAAVQRGTTVVVAAGNNSANASGYQPASCNNVVNVASTDRQGAKSSFSNYGTLIDVAAPGSSILSTINTGSSSPGSEGYSLMNGTSMASPHVAGVVALIQAAAGSSPKTPAQVEQILKDTARALPGSCSGGCGAGIVNAKAAVDAVGGGDGAPVAGFDAVPDGLTVAFTDRSTDAGGSIASRSWDFGDGTSSTATNPPKTYSAAGTYTVKLTVTDNDGKTDDESKSVTVGSGGGTVLVNGTPVTGLAGATGASLRYTMDVPAGATNLKFVTNGGTGDPDVYAKFNAAPTTTSADCKSEAPTTAETCSIANAQAGTYHVLVYGYAQFSGVSLTGSYSTGGGGRQTYSNAGDYQIRDNATVESPITVSGRSGNAPSNTSVAVNIVHTFRGDLKVDLVAPDGSVYVLKTYNANDSADNVNTTYTANVSTEALNGTWKLRVNDNAANDTGYINSWSVTF